MGSAGHIHTIDTFIISVFRLIKSVLLNESAAASNTVFHGNIHIQSHCNCSEKVFIVVWTWVGLDLDMKFTSVFLT